VQPEFFCNIFYLDQLNKFMQQYLVQGQTLIIPYFSKLNKSKCFQVLYLVFPGCRVLLDGVHVERYFREKVFPGESCLENKDNSQVWPGMGV
jgi:hypothetical protein